MTYTTVPLSSLLVPHHNPRRSVDRKSIVALAESIRQDGVLQNLIVAKEADDRFRVIAGQRRYLALRLLRSRRDIQSDYLVPAEIRDGAPGDQLRVATVENIQREALNAIDEAEAFAKMIDAGDKPAEIAAKVSINVSTIRRRLALSLLCDEAKRALRKGQLTVSKAEALTLGSHEQQRSILRAIRNGQNLDTNTIKDELLGAKPKLQHALFSPELYTGTTTRDLFESVEEAYCDDVDQFFLLQREAVEKVAEQYRSEGFWVEISDSGPQWWKYRDARDGEAAGTVIAIGLDGQVDLRSNLARIEPTVGRIERHGHDSAKKRDPAQPSAVLLRYVANHRSAAVQAAALNDSRKTKEVAVTLLLSPIATGGHVTLRPHPCLAETDGNKGAADTKKRFQALLAAFASSRSDDASPADVLHHLGIQDPLTIYERCKTLTNEELDAAVTLLIIGCFGQPGLDWVDTEPSLVNAVATDLKVNIREWWAPDAAYLSRQGRDQLVRIAQESGAINEVAASVTKRVLVERLAEYFAEASELANAWMPNSMRFPAS